MGTNEETNEDDMRALSSFNAKGSGTPDNRDCSREGETLVMHDLSSVTVSSNSFKSSVGCGREKEDASVMDDSGTFVVSSNSLLKGDCDREEEEEQALVIDDSSNFVASSNSLRLVAYSISFTPCDDFNGTLQLVFSKSFVQQTIPELCCGGSRVWSGRLLKCRRIFLDVLRWGWCRVWSGRLLIFLGVLRWGWSRARSGLLLIFLGAFGVRFINSRR